MSITGMPEGDPTKVGVAIIDVIAGLMLGKAICAALYAREKTGTGQTLDTSLLEAQVASLVNAGANYLIGGQIPRRYGNAHPSIVPYQSFKTADGYLVVGVASETIWKRFCRAIGAEDLLNDPNHATGKLRSQHRKSLNERIAAITRTNTSAHWIDALNKAGVPCGPINTIDKTFAEPQVQHLGIARGVTHPKLGAIKVVGQPINMTAAPQPAELKPTPDLGEHSAEILGDLGYDSAAIAKLRERGAI